MRKTLLLAFLCFAGCSSEAETPATTDARADGQPSDTAANALDATSDTEQADTATAETATADTTTADTEATDAESPADAPDPDCQADKDCKLFASYCATDPCKCLGLVKDESPPKCTGTTVACLVDPCATSTAKCVSGTCIAEVK